MTPTEAPAEHSACHPEVWALLPWMVNGTLEGQDRRAVEEGLDTCSSCRAELARCHMMAAATLATPAAPWTPSTADVSRILSRIDAVEAPRSSVAAWWGRRRDQIREFLASLWPASPVLRWTLGAQAALVLLLASLVVWQASSPAPAYQTLTRGVERRDDGRPQIRVAFAEDASERELRDVLRSVGGTLVDGPSEIGVYTVRLEPTVASPAAALTRLRAHPKVRLAEPATDR